MAAAILRLTTGVVYARSISGTLTFTSGSALALADGTAAAPSLTFASATTRGFFLDGTNNSIGITVGGSQQGYWNAARLGLFGDLSFGSSADVVLARDAANTLALRNGTNAQTFNIYNTYTSATNFENARAYWSGNQFNLFTDKGSGGGASRQFNLGTTGVGSLYFYTGNVGRWTIDNNGHFIAVTDNTYDIGASGANRPRNGYFGSAVNAGGNINVAGGSSSSFRDNATGTKLSFPGTDGVAQFLNNGSTGFTRLILGTNDATTGGVSIKKNNTAIQIRTGDDTGWGGFKADTAIAQSSFGLGNSSTLFISATAPTISSGFGTSPSISASNGTAAFTITVGTGGTDTSGVITLPAASTGWIVFAQDMTTPGVNATKQTASSTTSATLTNYNTTTGVAAAWTAGDVIRCIAVAY